ncbi:hypothetical protein CPC16_011053 [Podila verticillata]|nr:hypothetical protein BGZ52_003317 [Haplosporangium bisporale]KAF9210359.1 hypothetical protein BGZ59_009531 [Podila verticillata]KAF9394537.1 hypothetical protein CPC16_011053 [Podila verticillata]KAI9237497.1 MAG: hypothetical protein BYD32DRAFT_296781 [Podila humilis]KFH63370.1 hypothetical protein MVEG_10780 [Podila verticillata NRRL 6337]
MDSTSSITKPSHRTPPEDHSGDETESSSTKPQYRGFQKSEGLTKRIESALMVVIQDVPLPNERGAKDKWDRNARLLEEQSLENGDTEYIGITGRTLKNMVERELKAFLDREQAAGRTPEPGKYSTEKENLLATIHQVQEDTRALSRSGRNAEVYSAHIRAMSSSSGRRRLKSEISDSGVGDAEAQVDELMEDEDMDLEQNGTERNPLTLTPRPRSIYKIAETVSDDNVRLLQELKKATEKNVSRLADLNTRMDDSFRHNESVSRQLAYIISAMEVQTNAINQLQQSQMRMQAMLATGYPYAPHSSGSTSILGVRSRSRSPSPSRASNPRRFPHTPPNPPSHHRSGANNF